MKGNLLNPTTETLPAASLITLPVISSPLQLYRLYTMVTIALPFIFRRWDCSVYGGTVGLKCGSAPIYIIRRMSPSKVADARPTSHPM